ncbi:MAG TPA: SRPBCC family protein [Actinomycetota bacterium]|nr:SRPBCC family protein [Actinomycetota bacterium]
MARVDQRDGGRVSVVEVLVEVEAPPERVWEVVSDPRKLSHWDRHVESVEGVPVGGLAEGVRYTTVMRFMAVRGHVAAEVLEFEPPHRSVILLTGLIDAIVTTTVEPLPGERSLLKHVIDYHFRGGAIGEFAARSLQLLGGAQLALRHGTLAQKREIERRS